jgi:hypothetical protein
MKMFPLTAVLKFTLYEKVQYSDKSERDAHVPSPEDDGRRENYDAGCQ